MANQARQSSPDTGNNNASSPVNAAQNPSSYYHHYSATAALGQNSTVNAGYSPPQNVSALNGNESPNSVDQYPTNNSNNNIQLPDTPNSLTTIMGPTSGNSNSNDGTNGINESPSENATIIANNNNNNYSPWACTTTGHHQLPLSNSPIHSSSYNHHPSASLYSAHHNLLPHQNISSFAHPHGSKGFGMSQPFYSWY